jgi:hypothetical protein
LPKITNFEYYTHFSKPAMTWIKRRSPNGQR